MTHKKITFIKLNEVKNYINLFALDYDGTLYDHHDPYFNHIRAAKLIAKILNNYHVAIITARAASAAKYIIPLIIKCRDSKDSKFRFFLAGGNGTILYELRNEKLIQIYNRGLNLRDVQIIINKYKKIFNYLKINREELNSKGVQIFSEFVRENWTGLIPKEFLLISKQFKGRLFAEEAKISFVQPIDNIKRDKLISVLKANLSHKYTLLIGDIDFHVTKKFTKDGKVTAIEKIMDLLNISSGNVITFGDLPDGNDKGLLSYPYSFTNNVKFNKEKRDFNKPPFILPQISTSSIMNVFKAIKYLID